MRWNDHDVRLAIKMWNNGLSAGEIAKKMPGRSRNAIISKLFRCWEENNPQMIRPLGDKKAPIRIWSENKIFILLAMLEPQNASTTRWTTAEAAAFFRTSKHEIQSIYRSTSENTGI